MKLYVRLDGYDSDILLSVNRLDVTNAPDLVSFVAKKVAESGQVSALSYPQILAKILDVDGQYEPGDF